MARMPGAQWVGEHGSVLMTEKSLNKVCEHTIVGNPPAHAAHFSVRADGHIFQSRDTRYRSAANLYGNDDVIAIENDDHGIEYGWWDTRDGHAVPGFTPAQIESNARIIAWAHHTHGIPIVLCPDSRDESEGIAFHRQGCDGNYAGYAYGGRIPGGELWSSSRGKVCPGDRRITQLIQLIIPRARILARLDTPPPMEEIDMANVELLHSDSNNRTPGGRYRWGDFVFMVKYDPQLPGGAIRRYIPAGLVFERARMLFGPPKEVSDDSLSEIPVEPGGEIPPDLIDATP